MSCMISVYKEGSAVEVRGVSCEVKRIPIGKLPEFEKQGYKKDLNELYSTEPPKPAKKRAGRPKKTEG